MKALAPRLDRDSLYCARASPVQRPVISTYPATQAADIETTFYRFPILSPDGPANVHKISVSWVLPMPAMASMAGRRAAPRARPAYSTSCLQRFRPQGAPAQTNAHDDQRQPDARTTSGCPKCSADRNRSSGGSPGRKRRTNEICASDANVCSAAGAVGELRPPARTQSPAGRITEVPTPISAKPDKRQPSRWGAENKHQQARPRRAPRASNPRDTAVRRIAPRRNGSAKEPRQPPAPPAPECHRKAREEENGDHRKTRRAHVRSQAQVDPPRPSHDHLRSASPRRAP